MASDRLVRFGFALVCAVLLVSCGDSGQPTSLPEGQQTLSGVLLPAEISLVRRGTHLLQIDGKDTYFVESPTVNLRSYERKELTVEGRIEANVSAEFLPVLIVSRIVSVAHITLKEWQVHSLDLSLSVPDTWSADSTDGRISFRVSGSGSPVIAVYSQSGAIEGDASTGVPVVVGTVRGMRTVDEVTGAQKITVERGKKAVVFVFDPADRTDAQLLREQWLAMLNSVAFEKSPVVSSAQSGAVASGSGSALPSDGSPCGGPAGILCPAGQYCNISDFEQNIGKCEQP